MEKEAIIRQISNLKSGDFLRILCQNKHQAERLRGRLYRIKRHLEKKNPIKFSGLVISREKQNGKLYLIITIEESLKIAEIIKDGETKKVYIGPPTPELKVIIQAMREDNISEEDIDKYIKEYEEGLL